MFSNPNLYLILISKTYIFIKAHVVNIFLVVKKGCFPSKTKVKLENGKIVTMSELQKGDKVQTGNKKDR